MSYAAAGLARGISGGLGTIAQALMGIKQNKLAEQEMAQREERLRIAAEQEQSDRAVADAEAGITRGVNPTAVRFGGASIGAGGMSGAPIDLPSDVFAGGPRLRGPGGVVPTGGPSPFAMRAPGMLEPGNIDIAHRPSVQNEDGSYSTVRSMSIGEDGREVLIPTVSMDGRIMSDDDAIGNYERTGQNLGAFSDVAGADAYASRLHDQQAAYGTADRRNAPGGAAYVAPSPEAPSIMTGQGVGMAPTRRLKGLPAAGRSTIETPAVGAAPDVSFREDYATIDPMASGAVRRQIALNQLKQQPPAITMDGKDFPDTPQGMAAAKAWHESLRAPADPRARRTGFQPETGNLVDMDTGETIRPGAGGSGGAGGGGIPGINKLPTAAQTAISSVSGIKQSITNYRSLVNDYLAESAGKRALGQFGVSGAGLDAKLGALQAAQGGLQLQIKNLAQLGQISAGDQGFLNSLVGEATSKQALYRDPSYVTSRIDELEKYIGNLTSGYESTYGVKVPGAGGPTTSPAGPSDSDIDAMIAAGMSDEEIAAKLGGN